MVHRKLAPPVLWFMLVSHTLLHFISPYKAAAANPDSENFRMIKGKPRIIHYTRKDFDADPQFWDMCEGKDGLLYFGNNDGALVFDGERWHKVLLPNNSSVRSLLVSQDGTIYAGGYNQFGMIRQDKFGSFHFESLGDLLRPEDRNFETIWKIHEVQDHILFRSFKSLIAITGQKAATLPSESIFGFSAVIEGNLYLTDNQHLKILDLATFEFSEIADQHQIKLEGLTALLPGFEQGQLLAVTKPGDLYLIDAKEHKVQFIRDDIPNTSNNLFTCALKSINGDYYLGTLSNKLVTLDEAGNKITLSEVYENLQDQTVLNLYQTSEGNIWVLLNNGVDCIEISSPVSLLLEDASVYDVLAINDQLIVATNQGVFRTFHTSSGPANSSLSFTNLPGLEGQTWSLQYFENKVICSHDRGVFILKDDQIIQLPDLSGVWKVIAVKNKPNRYLACTYDGLFLIEYSVDKGFQLKHKLDGFSESSRDILQSDENGVFWVCHGYKGVFRIKINDDYTRVVSVEHFKDQNGLPSPFNINVFRWKDEVVFTTNNGIFTFNEKRSQFLPHPFLTGLFGDNLNVRKLLEHGDRTWFVHDDEAGYFSANVTKPELEKSLFLQLKGSFNRSMECIVPFGENSVLMGTNTGLFSFDLTHPASEKKSLVHFSEVSNLQTREVVRHPVSSGTSNPLQLPFQSNGIHFSFSVPGFQDKANVEFSYMLDDVDEEWSAWQEMPQKDYSHLSPGKYTFQVKARSLLGENSEIGAYYFEVLPKWYQTNWAIGLFSVLGISMLALAVTYVNRKISREKEKTLAEEKKLRKVLELELQQVKLENEKHRIEQDKEKLKDDVLYKSKELANYAMLLAKKRELLIEISEPLEKLKEQASNEKSRDAIRKLIRQINLNLQDEEHLQLFDANFEQVHHEFFHELKTNYPDLSQKELRLCAFVKMNLPNKEIASILNISLRGVETARYRLRKKLSLDHNVNMTEFLEKLADDKDYENVVS